tara:strand:- start:102 stop:242 length:141 start_codon:yes stop_codon:yes gene_type:complete
MNSKLIEELKEYFNDHYEHFKFYPMVFEYEGVEYNFDECAELLGWD